MFSVNLLRRNNNTLLVEQIGLQGYVMGMINFGAIRFAIAPYLLIKFPDYHHDSAPLNYT